MNRLLAESQVLARLWARGSCWHDDEIGQSCAWYHGAWQTLRLLGVFSTLTHHAALYIDALRPLIAEGTCKRVFISGSADYGLLSVVLDAFSRAGAEPDITVVDRCTTPLRLCQWYAERFGYTITTAQSDLPAFRSEVPFDVVCAHSLLACVPVEHHEEVVANWHRLLRPGGILMMANHVHPGATSKQSRFKPDEVPAYQGRVAEAAAHSPHRDALPPAEELDRLAEGYAMHKVSNIVGSRAQLTGLLEAQGFELLEARFGGLIKDPSHRSSGVPVNNKKEYAWIVARRS